MRTATCNLCGATKRSALARCSCAPAPVARPGLALAARLIMDVNVNAPDSGDALVYRQPALVVMGAAAGLYAWRRSGAPWPEDEHGQKLLIGGFVALVMGALSLVMGAERFHRELERLKRMNIGIISVPIVLGLITLAALMSPR